MSQTIVTPPLTHTVRRALARMWDEPESRSILIGIVGTILVHLLLLLIGPSLLRSDPASALAARAHARPRQFSIQLSPEMTRPPPKPRALPKFVEVNPNAPENVPDKTDNVAERNQQVAQEKPTPNGKSERPATEGQKDIKSTQIVDGRLEKPQEQAAVPPTPVATTESKLTAPRQEQSPLSGFDKKVGTDASGYGTNIAKPTEAPKDIPNKIEGLKNVPLIEGATDAQPAIDPHHPRARPQVVRTVQTRPAIFEENKIGTSNVGVRGQNANWSHYGEYMHKLTEIVQMQFDKLNDESRVSPPTGTVTSVKFSLNSEGKIRIISVDSSKGTEQAARISVSSISIPSPYAQWTDDMKAMLGDEDEMTFDFYYR
jgi:hypothetical protein